MCIHARMTFEEGEGARNVVLVWAFSTDSPTAFRPAKWITYRCDGGEDLVEVSSSRVSTLWRRGLPRSSLYARALLSSAFTRAVNDDEVEAGGVQFRECGAM